MTLELLTGLAGFALVTSITPGPNNLMLLSSGANFGFRRSLPHMLGISLGFAAMTALVGIGVIEIFERWPWVRQGMLAATLIYLVYLAWRIATAAAPGDTGVQGRPMSCLAAAGFQWINPKAWVMALTAVTVYTEHRALGEVLLVALVFGLINLPSVGVWTVLGQQLRRLLRSPRRLRVFNVCMALLLLVSVYPAFALD